MTDTSRNAVEQHLDISTNHEAGLIPTATVIIVRALLARAETAEAEWDNALSLAAKMATLMQRMDEGRLDAIAERDALRAEVERLTYVLGGVRAAILTGRNEPLQIWKDQIDIALEARP